LSQKQAGPQTMANLALKTLDTLLIFFWQAFCTFANSAYFFVLGVGMVLKIVA
jgi:hypothetical protein